MTIGGVKTRSPQKMLNLQETTVVHIRFVSMMDNMQYECFLKC